MTGAVTACIYIIGWGETYPAEPGREVAGDIDKLPVVVFSHGIGTNRYLYSTLSSYLASHGFLVAAMEHTDGLASSAKPAGDRCALTAVSVLTRAAETLSPACSRHFLSACVRLSHLDDACSRGYSARGDCQDSGRGCHACRKWIYYSGWGDREYLESCSKHREQELFTCMKVLTAIDMRGSGAEHVTATCVRGSDHVSGILDSLQGRLDLQNIALLGHSYGGATVAGALLLCPGNTACPLHRRSRKSVNTVFLRIDGALVFILRGWSASVK